MSIWIPSADSAIQRDLASLEFAFSPQLRAAGMYIYKRVFKSTNNLKFYYVKQFSLLKLEFLYICMFYNRNKDLIPRVVKFRSFRIEIKALKNVYRDSKKLQSLGPFFVLSIHIWKKYIGSGVTV